MSNDWFDFFTEDDEQKQAMDKVEELLDGYLKDTGNKATHLYVSDHEELQSYMLWAGMALNMQVQRTGKRFSYVNRDLSAGNIPADRQTSSVSKSSDKPNPPWSN